MNNDLYALSAEPLPPSVSDSEAQAFPWLAGLNPEQRQAVAATEGPLLVLSGAGTGKTRVLTTRLAHILMTKRVAPWRVLAVTFTNRAAREMRERVTAMVGDQAEQVWLGTFHALCLKILRRHPGAVGLKSGFTILDADDQGRVLKALMEERGVDVKQCPVPAVLGTIQRWKDRAWTPGAVPSEECRDHVSRAGRELYQGYQDRLLSLNACDFGDLLLHAATLFQAFPDVLARYQDQFLYILVDEYQDANVAQYLWLRLLARKHRNLCCVGDDDQSIYSWRGAEIGNILRFEHDFPGAQVVRLERNYRSTPSILRAAAGLIRCNSGRLGKELRAEQASGEGEKVVICGVWDARAEARWVVERIETLQRAGESLSSMAVLVRTAHQTREFEEHLMAMGIPYRVVGGPRFYERMEIRDALAYLRLIVQPADDLAFERILNAPKRGLGQGALQMLHKEARAGRRPLLATARAMLDVDGLRPKMRSALRAFVGQIDAWATLAASLSPAALCEEVLASSGYREMWTLDRSPDAAGRVENLGELVNTLGAYGSLESFLEHVALVMENDAKADALEAATLMTLHAAKGLEFDTVFLPGWEEELFPNRRALDEGGQRSLEEERRLAYVGLTRARKRAMILHAGQRRVYNEWRICTASRFIEEIPAACVERFSEIGYGAGYDGSALSLDWGGRPGSGEGLERLTKQDAVPSSQRRLLKTGDRVFHGAFGAGVVLEVEGEKLGVAFDDGEIKKLIARFVSKI